MMTLVEGPCKVQAEQCVALDRLYLNLYLPCHPPLAQIYNITVRAVKEDKEEVGLQV